jgi:hypothetical protein
MNRPYIGADKEPCIYVTMTTANRTAQIELKWAKYKKSVPGTLSTRPYFSSPQMGYMSLDDGRDQEALAEISVWPHVKKAKIRLFTCMIGPLK